MKILFTTQLLVVAVALSSTVAFTTEAQASDKITFECVRSGSDWATVARRGTNKPTAPIIVWHTQEFGPEYTPKNRCDMVNAKLAWLAVNNGNKLYTIRMKAGYLNGFPVICYITKETSVFCDRSNLLMTLPKRSNPREQLSNLFGRIDTPYLAGTPVQNSAPDYEVDFGNAVERLLDAANSQGQGTGSNVAPVENQGEGNTSGDGSL